MTANSLFVWDYTHQNKVLSLNNLSFLNVVTDSNQFFASDHRGLLYRYDSQEIAQRGLAEEAIEE